MAQEEMKILITIVLSVLAAILYRMGGSGRYPRQARMVGVPLVSILAMLVLGIHSWWLLLCMGIMVGAISTYWDFINGSDSFWLHGLFVGLAMLPLIGVVHWYAIIIRSLVLATFMGAWCKGWSWDIAEETGRGFSIVATMPLLLI
jgi:hypothetical protein